MGKENASNEDKSLKRKKYEKEMRAAPGGALQIAGLGEIQRTARHRRL